MLICTMVTLPPAHILSALSFKRSQKAAAKKNKKTQKQKNKNLLYF